MRRTSFRLRLCAGLIFANLLFIWGNSLLPGEASGALSRWLGELLASIFPGASTGTPGGGHVLRKLAHFSEFACLGALLGWLTGMLKKPNFGVPTGLGCLAACVDETIQRFVPGRGPSLTDVGIDTCGAAVGAILLLVGYTIYHKTHTLEVTT